MIFDGRRRAMSIRPQESIGIIESCVSEPVEAGTSVFGVFLKQCNLIANIDVSIKILMFSEFRTLRNDRQLRNGIYLLSGTRLHMLVAPLAVNFIA